MNPRHNTRLISYMYFQWINFYGLYKIQKIKNHYRRELIFTMTIIFAKFPFQTNLLIPSSKLVIHVSAYLIWCPYIIQKATIFNPLIFIFKTHDLSWFLFFYNTYSNTAITTTYYCCYCSGCGGGGSIHTVDCCLFLALFFVQFVVIVIIVCACACACACVCVVCCVFLVRVMFTQTSVLRVCKVY